MADAHAKPHHDYHLVDPSPWPAIGAVSAFVTAVGAIPIVALVYTTVGGTAIAYLLWFYIVQRLPAGTALFCGTVPAIGPCPVKPLPRNGCSPSKLPRYVPNATNRCDEKPPWPSKRPHGPVALRRLTAALCIVPPNDASARSNVTPAIVASLPPNRPANTISFPPPLPASVMSTDRASIGGISGSVMPGNAL